MLSKNKIEAVIFDIGNVLIELDFQRLLKNIGLNNMSIEDLNSWPPYDAFERGKIEVQVFKKELEKLLSTTFEEKEFITRWNSVFIGEVPGISKILEKINVPIYSLTNTNELHLTFCFKNYPVLGLFKKIFTSYEFKARKPEKEIFYSVLKWLNIEANSLLFIDDNEKNLNGARDCGMIGEHCFNCANRLKMILNNYNLL